MLHLPSAREKQQDLKSRCGGGGGGVDLQVEACLVVAVHRLMHLKDTIDDGICRNKYFRTLLIHQSIINGIALRTRRGQL